MDDGAVDDGEAEGLRRRLYRPGASADDLARYRGVARPPRAPAAPPPARRRRRRMLVAVLLAAVVVVVAVLLARPAASPGPAPTPVALSGEDRQELLGNLARGGAAGIAAYLVTHPSPPGLAGARDPVTREFTGAGTSTVTIPAPGWQGAGRMTVLVVLGSSGHVRWTADRLGTDGSRVVRLQRAATRQGDQAAGDLTTTTFAFADGRRPVRLEVDVDGVARWGAAVVFSR